MNNIDRWLRDNGHNSKTMGKRIGINENSFRRYLTGWRLPSWEVMDKLERVTAGAITPNDFLPLYRRRLKEARKRREPEVETLAAE